MAKVNSETGSWLHYYKDSLIEGAFLSSHNPKKNIMTDLKNVEDLHNIDIDKVFSKSMKDFINQSFSEKDFDGKFVLLPLHYTTPSNGIIYPFSIPFMVEKDNHGNLHINPPERGSFPVISRDFLSPNNDKYPPIAELKDFWKASQDIRNKEYDTWVDFIKEVFDFFKKVTKIEVGNNLGNGFKWNILAIDKGDVITIYHIQKLYNKITSDSKFSIYYEKLFNRSNRDEEIVKENCLHASKCHFGHMDNKFSLSRTQREAIHSWIENDRLQNDNGNMSVMAVNGPPGTGKTTFLSGLIASHIVRSVYNKKYPRFMLTSFTNKAVTNIIDSFSRCAKNIRLIDTDKEVGLSLHFANKSDYLFINKKSGEFEGSLLDVEQKFRSDEAIDKYIANAEKELRITLSIKQLRKDKINKISSYIYKQLCYEYSKISEINGIDDIRNYDIGPRFNAYKWAVRWLECEWIKNRPNNTDVSSKELMEWRMLLTPCIVGTAYKLPQWFEEKGENSSEYSYWFEDVDYLIIDEAGQGSPEVAVPLFGLAKNAVIVGDTEQLQPIWAINPEWDQNIQSEIFAVEPKDNTVLSSSGSIMSVAQKACPLKSQGTKTRGAILLNHRRCYKEIIELCNALCYSDQGYSLETNTSPQESSYYQTFIGENEIKDPVFPIGLVEVNGHCVRDKSIGSNKNQEETDAIVKWVETYWEVLVDAYANKEDVKVVVDKKTLIKNVLAILTPYRGQENQIRQALESKGLFLKEFPMVIGTVHKLQGAECPVVLFSTVLDGSVKSHPEFIDKHMLNVAVSRAKKSFIVFSNPLLYKIVEEGSPLDIMKKYIDNWTENHHAIVTDDLPSDVIKEGERMAAENCYLREEKSNLIDKNLDLFNKNAELEKRIQEQDDEILHLKQTIENQSEDIRSYKLENSDLRSQIEHVQISERKLTTLNSALIHDKTALNFKVQYLNNRLDEIQTSPKMALRIFFKAIAKRK